MIYLIFKTFKGEITALWNDIYMDAEGNKIPYELSQAADTIKSGRCSSIEEMKNILKNLK